MKIIGRKLFPGLVPFLFILGYTPILSGQLSAANFGLDGGDLVTAALVNGIAHPSGYPAYLVLVRPFLALPWETPYWRASFFSVWAASLAAWLIYRFCVGNRQRMADLAAGVAGALAVFGAALFASQAVIPEVNVLNVVFVLAILGWAGEIGKTRDPGRRLEAGIYLRLFLLALVGGLGLGNHLSAVLALPLVVFESAKTARKGAPARLFLIQAGGFLGGMAVYLVLPLAARNFPPVNWGNPQSLEGFWWLISGTPYQGLLFQIPLEIFVNRLILVGQMLVDQFTPPGAALAILGLISAGQNLRWRTLWIFSLFCLFACGYATQDSVVYLLPAWAMVGIWIGTGAIKLVNLDLKGSYVPGRVLMAAAGVWLAVHALDTLPRIDPRRDTATGAYLEAISELPQGAIFLTGTDAESFPAWYVVFGLGQRPDLRVIVLPLTRFRWYQETLAAQYPDLAMPELKERNASSSPWGEDLLKLNPQKTACRSKIEGDPPKILSVRCGEAVLFSGEVFSENGW